MEPRTAALLSLSFLLLLTHESLTKKGPQMIHLKLTVKNKLSNTHPKSYSASENKGDVLLSAMTRLQNAHKGFTFTVKEYPNLGPYLVSVNGVAGVDEDHTYWELLSEKSGKYTSLPLGIGSYIPKANEHIVFNFTKW